MNNRSQLIENGKFELELDTVESAFEGDLDIVEVGIFGSEERDVHQDH